MTTAKLVSDTTDNQGPIRAVLVEDHPVVRCGLKALIDNQEDMTVVGEAESGGSALELLKHISCDVIVADLSLGDINGIEMIRRVRNSDIETRILIVSMHEEELYAERALKAGARGYFMKTAPPAELLNGIRQVVRNEVALSRDQQDRLLRRVVQGGPSDDLSPYSVLSNRELEIFELLGQGTATRLIAEKLFISVKTVEAHYAHIKRKLGVQTQPQLLRLAFNWLNEI